jgi:limonene-1,2-epoxide hydrolase
LDREKENAGLVQDFFSSWSRSFESMIAGFEASIAKNCLLQQTKTPDLNGLDAIVAFLKQVRDAGVFETIEVEIRNLIVTDRYVISERVDYLRNRDGKVVATCPCVGVMEIRGGRIAAWRDYFDSADMQAGAMAVVATA